MSKQNLNDEQMEKASGGGVINYFKGGLKIIAGTAIAAGSVAVLTEKDKSIPYLSEISRKLGDKKKIGGAAGCAAGAYLVLDGISQIQDEKRNSNK